ncbi:MAG: purine-binding chemotaxis protein CheW [Deltaproteobacteria bacterium]|nr:purine-binding chemotaxis protein CheW [Deltaproteobacteria bacterium]
MLNQTDGAAQYLTFFVAGEEYAIAILRVEEIIQYRPITRVPGTPACISGVINLRGHVVPVVDLAVKLGQPPSLVARRTCIVVVQARAEDRPLLLGIIADSVHQVVDLRPEDIEPPPPFGVRIRLEYLTGMVRMDAKFALLLDIDRVLGTEELLGTATLTAAEAATAHAAPSDVSRL